MIRPLALAAAAVLLACFAAPVLAAPLILPKPALRGTAAPIPVQSCEGDCGCDGECPEPEPEPKPEPKPVFQIPDQERAKGTTQEFDGSVGPDIETLLARGTAACGDYDEVWRIDCLSVELERVAARLPRTRAYDNARAEVAAAAARLHAIAMANADPARPAVRREATVKGTKVRTTRPITPVARPRVAAANAQAEAVVDELATTLLRAGPTRTAQRELARVAQAVDSTKVLLRSS